MKAALIGSWVMFALFFAVQSNAQHDPGGDGVTVTVTGPMLGEGLIRYGEPNHNKVYAHLDDEELAAIRAACK